MVRVNGFISFSVKHKKPHSDSPGLFFHLNILTQPVTDGFLNMGRGFSFIPRRLQRVLELLVPVFCRVSGGTVDLVKQLERANKCVQIPTMAPLATQHLAVTLIHDRSSWEMSHQ